MELIDTHIHLYAKEFDDDRDELIKAARQNGITHFLMPAIDMEWSNALHAVADSYPETCIPMMGVHPCSVKEDYRKELAHAEKNLAIRKYCAIGEMGIDLYWDKSFIKEQDIVFKEQCKWANQLHLPIVIHSRDATAHAIDLLHELNLPGLKGVFHCFTGDAAQADEIIKMGFMLGIGGVVTFKNGGIDKLLPDISKHSIVFETDAPYLAPVPNRGKRNEPAYLKIAAEKTAAIYNMTLDEIATVTSANAKSLFRI